VRSLFVMDPIASLNLAGDSTYVLMRESTARGWPCHWCTPADLHVRDGVVRARAEPVRTTERHFDRDIAEERPLGDWDLVWMRKDPPFDMTYVFATYLLSMAPPRTLVLNAPEALRSRNEKLFAAAFVAHAPPTLITHEIPRIVAFAAEHGRIVLKPWDGNGGRGVLVTGHGDPNLRSMVELLTGEGSRYILAQRYLPEIREGDKRIILVAGEPRGAILRVPAAHDHRGNMHVGATVHKATLDEADQAICAAIGPTLRAEGMLFVGIDVIGGHLTEINVTSPTGIQEIDRLDGVRLEAEILDAAVRRHAGAPA
jgi:glutathione synthase